MKTFFLLVLTPSLLLPNVIYADEFLSSNTTLHASSVLIPSGPFLMGSDKTEREYGYRLDESRNSSASRRFQWFENETPSKPYLPDYWIDKNLVSNKAYQRFIDATNAFAPNVDKSTWDSYRLVHPYQTAQRFIWHKGRYPRGRGDHPVILVSYNDARNYCQWRGARLPNEAEWEKAARGTDGRYFPWGNNFDAEKLNSADAGPYDTDAIDQYDTGASPFGVLNMAGMVFEWTSTQCPNPNRSNASVVKGGSWDDYPGVTRAAAKHCRPNTIKHVLIGFRCAGDVNEK